MKTFFAVLLVTWSFAASVAFADDYPRFWRGNKNYPMVWAHMGTAFYLDKSSVKVKLSEPPYYIITAVTIPVSNSGVTPDHPRYNKDEKPGSLLSYEFFYDEDEADMRSGYNSNWRYLRPQGSNAESGMTMYVGEAVFYVATGRKFYGNYVWKHISYNGETDYWDLFKDNYYKDLR